MFKPAHAGTPPVQFLVQDWFKIVEFETASGSYALCPLLMCLMILVEKTFFVSLALSLQLSSYSGFSFKCFNSLK